MLLPLKAWKRFKLELYFLLALEIDHLFSYLLINLFNNIDNEIKAK